MERTVFNKAQLEMPLQTMKRLVVLDTNCLVQMLSVHSPYRAAWQAFREGKYELCVTDDIVDEYEEKS